MDFKFRAGDDNPAAKISSSASNVNCFPRQTVRGGFPGPDLMGNSNDFHIRGVIQREMEKERIRQEIMMEEIVRRRVLEAEVRREMAMEREVAMRRAAEIGLPFNERMTMWLPYENRLALGLSGYGGCSNVLPPQIPRMSEPVVAEVKREESNVEKLIVLPRPNLTVATLKRKAEAPPEVNTDSNPPFGLKKKPKEEWSCALCEVSCTNEMGFNLHLKGKKHKVKEAGLRAQSASKNANGVASTKGVVKNVSLKTGKEVEKKSLEIDKTDDGLDQKDVETLKCRPYELLLPSPPLGKQSESKKMKGNAKSKKNNFKHWCELCEVGTHSKKVMMSHERGKKHIALLNRIEINGKVVATTVAAEITTTTNTGGAANTSSLIVAAGTETTIATGTTTATTAATCTVNTTTVAAQSVPTTITNDSAPTVASVFLTTTTAANTTTTIIAADTDTTAIAADTTNTAIAADTTNTAIAADTATATASTVALARRDEGLVGN